MKKMHLILAALMLLSSAALQAAGLKVSPNPAEVQVNAAAAFTAQGMEPEAVLSWEVVPATLGNIDKNGVFTASGKPGRGMVRAIAKNKDGRTVLGHAMIKVLGNKHGRLAVSVLPARAELKIGETLRFTARIMLPEENVKTEWMVIPNDLGTIDAQGIFAAKSIGTGRVVAVISAKNVRGLGQAAIAVTPQVRQGRLSVSVSPKRVQVRPGNNLKFNVTVTDSNGNPVTGNLKFQLSPNTIGTIDNSGYYIASKNAGIGILKVTAYTKNTAGNSRAFIIISEKNQQFKVKIKPRQTVLSARESIQLTAEAFDSEGNQVIPPYWRWKVIPEEMGTITPDGLFTAGNKPINGKVVARLPVIFGAGHDVALIKIKPGRKNIIKITPQAINLQPGQMQQFTANIIDSRGQAQNELKVVWKVMPSDLGTITPNGFFTASTQFKTGLVIASIPPKFGGGHGQALVQISRFSVRIAGSRPCYLNPGGIHSFSADVRDINGNTVTGVELQWYLKSLVPNFGTITPLTGIFNAGNPSILPSEGYVLVTAKINGVVIGGDGIKIIIR